MINEDENTNEDENDNEPQIELEQSGETDVHVDVTPEEQVKNIIETARNTEPEQQDEKPVKETEPEQQDEKPVKETEPEQQNEKPVKERVDVENDPPEKIQARINDLYKQKKMADQRNQMLTDFLMEQQKKIDAVYDKTNQDEQKQTEKVIMDKIIAAKEEDDDEQYVNALNELVEYRANNLIEEKSKEAEKDKGQDTNYKNAEYVASLAQETNSDGTLKRPWLHEDDPRHQEAVKNAAAIAYTKDPNDPNLMQEIMSELDGLMQQAPEAPKQQQPAPQPQTLANTPEPMSGSNLTNNQRRTKIKLSPQEQELARKLGQHVGWEDPMKEYANAKTRWGKNAKY